MGKYIIYRVRVFGNDGYTESDSNLIDLLSELLMKFIVKLLAKSKLKS